MNEKNEPVCLFIDLCKSFYLEFINHPKPFLVFISAFCDVASAIRFRITRLRRHSSFNHGRS